MIKRSCSSLLLAIGMSLAGLLFSSPSASAQANPLVTADEAGNGALIFPGGGTFTLAGVLAPDPGPGGLSSALTYGLLGPPGLVAGDVSVFDPITNLLSDIIRFNPANTSPGYAASFVFYSGLGGGQLADTGFPTASYTNTVSILEAANGVIFYTPTSAQPGYVPGFSISYQLTSSTDIPVTTVPDAGSSFILLGLGVAGLLLLGRFSPLPAMARSKSARR